MQPLSHDAIRLRHLGDLRGHGAFLLSLFPLRRAVAFSSWARSFIAPGSSSVNPSKVFLAAVVVLADFFVSLISLVEELAIIHSLKSWARSDPASVWCQLFLQCGRSVPLVALAAWQTLDGLAHVKAGQKVLVHAGAGGPGSTVIQVAKHLGAYVATTAHTNDIDKVRTLGADEVIDFTNNDFAQVLAGYDVVLDSLGSTNLEKSLTVLKPGGLAISVVGPPDPAFATQVGQPLLAPVMALISARSANRPRS